MLLNKMRLLTPGPTPLPEEVRLALATDMIHHRKDEFKAIMAEAQEKLRLLFGCATPVLPLSSSGTGAMTAAVYNLFSPGEKVAVIEAGKFGQRWREIAESRKLDIVPIAVEWGTAPDPAMLEEIFANNSDIHGVLLQLCETSTGVLLPVREIAEICARHNALCVVDGISAVGISPCRMDEWQLDCLLTGSQKGIMLPPGLALIALSEKAWRKTESVSPGCYYFNLSAEKNNILKNQTHFTTPVNLIVGLNKSLDLLLKNGLDSVYRKQWALTCLTRAGTQAMNLRPLVEKSFSWGVTAILMPENVNSGELLKYIQHECGIVMANGQDALKNRIIRIGHMGWVDWGDCMAGLLALAQSLGSLTSHICPEGFAVSAMQAYEKALKQGFPKA